MKESIKEYLVEAASYGNILVLGAYINSQFRCGVPIETYRWIGTSLAFVAFTVASHILRRNKLRDAKTDRGFFKYPFKSENQNQ